MDIRGVPDRAGVGPIVAQRGVQQRDGNVAPSRGALPPDAAGELTHQGEERLRGEVEKLGGETREIKIIQKM